MRTTRGWVAAVACAAAVAACVPLTDDEPADLVGETVEPVPALAGHVTSPDGTITVTLPDGWYDQSAPYLERVPDSSLSASWGTSPTFAINQEVFASVSTVPVTGATQSVSDLADAFADRWASGFADGSTTRHGEFATDAGGQAEWTRVEGMVDGDEITITAVVIVDHHRAGRIAIQSSPDEAAAADALLDALRTVELAPFDPADAGGTFVDGAFVVDGSISATIPSGWESYPYPDEVRDFALGREASYAGVWIIPAAGGAEAAEATVAGAPREYAAQTPEQFLEQAGSVGDVISTPTGTVEVTSLDQVTLANGMEGARACTRALEGDLPQGYEICTYVLTLDRWWFSATIDSLRIDPSASQELEDMLASVVAASA